MLFPKNLLAGPKEMNLLAITVFVTSLVISVYGYEPSELRCVVCKTVIKEINKSVVRESKTRTVDVGGYSMDHNGNVKKKTKLLVQSELFLSELMEKVCDKMSDYVRATEKETGKLVLINLLDLTAKPSLGDVDIIQDSDLNRSLEHLCKGIVEEFEDDVLETFGRRSASPIEDVCVKSTELCEEEVPVRYEL